MTNFPVTISIPASQIAALDSLSVTVDIVDANDADLGLKLIAPDGESITLFTNNSHGRYVRSRAADSPGRTLESIISNQSGRRSSTVRLAASSISMPPVPTQ